MERRNLILTAILSTLGVVLVLAVALYVFFWCHKRRRKREDAAALEDGASMAVTVRKEKESRNGFLNFKTPLISTKTLGRNTQSQGAEVLAALVGDKRRYKPQQPLQPALQAPQGCHMP